ncbi:TPA: hypothetical protein I7122_18585 [Vibrio vulnificus]|nr:hypothetical protein [Vibrio vulnificus]
MSVKRQEVDWVVSFLCNLFENKMKSGENLIVLVDKEKCQIEPIILKQLFCEESGIKSLYGERIKHQGKTIYFFGTDKPTIAGFCGNTLVVTNSNKSRKAQYISMSISMHKRWSRYVADIAVGAVYRLDKPY